MINLITAAFVLGALGLALWLVPGADGALHLGSGGQALEGMCLTRELLGLPCPFCGMMRSFVALAGLDLTGALALHPAGPLLALLYLGTGLAAAIAAVRGGPVVLSRPRVVGLLQVAAVACLVAGVARHVIVY